MLLFTSLPIYWNEAPDVAAMLAPGGETHWARRALERGHALVPLDALEPRALGKARALLIAQPRPFAPAENVALDAWVRGGGRVLLFADPALTAESAFALGDKRRPQDVVLLSPILARWGLRLTFDEDQAAGERGVAIDGAVLPVNLPGRFELAESLAGDACRLAQRGLVARCRVARGTVTAVADAALFEPASRAAGETARRDALTALTAAAFRESGQESGRRRDDRPS
ncbi:MAG TPA: ABC transporter [Novosphingobium sp.]|nr:ABC transporter [Novosphingobium sp.]